MLASPSLFGYADHGLIKRHTRYVTDDVWESRSVTGFDERGLVTRERTYEEGFIGNIPFERDHVYFYHRYDGSGLRVSRTVSGAAGAQTTRYVRDGGAVVGVLDGSEPWSTGTRRRVGSEATIQRNESIPLHLLVHSAIASGGGSEGSAGRQREPHAERQSAYAHSRLSRGFGRAPKWPIRRGAELECPALQAGVPAVQPARLAAQLPGLHLAPGRRHWLGRSGVVPRRRGGDHARYEGAPR